MPKNSLYKDLHKCPRTYVRRIYVKQKYRIDNVLAPDSEYNALLELRKKQGREQIETYRAPFVRGCGLPNEQKKKRKKWKRILAQRHRSMLRREKKLQF